MDARDDNDRPNDEGDFLSRLRDKLQEVVELLDQLLSPQPELVPIPVRTPRRR